MKKYKSPIFKHIHQEATDLYEGGIITAAEMREFDQSCLVSGANASPVSTGGRRTAMAASASSISHGRNVK
jgi:putative transcriptional regulator